MPKKRENILKVYGTEGVGRNLAVTIPLGVRKALGIGKGDTLAWKVRGGNFVLWKEGPMAYLPENQQMPMPKPEEHHLWCHDESVTCEKRMPDGRCGVAGTQPCPLAWCEVQE